MTVKIDPDALRRIEAAVQSAERTTAGEIVVVIAPRSAGWAGVRTAFALPLAALGAFVLARFTELHGSWAALLVPLLFAIAWLVASVPAVTRLLAGATALDERVLRSAKVAFLDHGVHATTTRAGVLVYLSLLERRVQVLGDSGVHAVIGDAGWATLVKRIAGAMHKHDVVDLIDVVRDVGATLARSFPRTADDVNELPDAVASPS